MLPIKHNQELISQPDTILVKVPDNLYQKWYSFAAHWHLMNKPVHKRQSDLFALLSEWLRNDYPEYGLVAFEDLRKEEAEVVSKKIGRPVKWGMYVLLQKGGSMQPMNIYELLEQGPKLIEL